MIERHVAFQILPEKAGAFDAFFRSAYAPTMARQPGFCGAELLRPESGDQLVMVLRFDSLEAAQAWRASDDHKKLSPTLKSLYQSSTVQVYTVLAEQPVG
ncbi:MAG TPA: antibiotic biosynthesis monooxygenase family protein [Anaerolineales bacterium]|nr:antibiotic biosynthesis monooxygenase family protein [Anaerolineales bacterium]